MEDFIFQAVGGVAFPAALCAYLIVKLDNTVKELTQAINNQSHILFQIQQLALTNRQKNERWS